MKGAAYTASEDSVALRSALRRYSGSACLEIGAGNGGTLVELAKSFDLVVGTDIVRPETTDWRESGANYVIADAASCFRRGAFELVAFNPPYVPSEGISDRAVDGGREGTEVALRFLGDALEAVRGDGRIVMLLSSDNPVGEFEAECARKGFAMTKVSERRLFYETLHVFEASAEHEHDEVWAGDSGHASRASIFPRLGRRAVGRASVLGRCRSAPGSQGSSSRRS
jgi:release factor glutamine methyltransferase